MLTINNTYDDDDFDKAKMFYTDNQYEQAIASVTRVIERDSQFIRAYDLRGNCYEKLGQYDRAMVDYNRALGIDSTFYVTLVNRGFLFRQMDMLRSSLADFEMAKRYCDNDRTHTMLNTFIDRLHKKLDDAE